MDVETLADAGRHTARAIANTQQIKMNANIALIICYSNAARTRQSFASSSLRKPADFYGESGRELSSLFASSQIG